MKLLTQVDEMDQKCTHLNELLNETAKEREGIKEKLAEMTEKCTQTLNSLHREKVSSISNHTQLHVAILGNVGAF